VASDDEIIERIKKSLKELAYEGIIKASDGGSKMGAFILASCFIDYLAGFYYGGESTPSHYKGFVKKFLPMYNRNSLYHDLRCKIVHNYSEGGSYHFIDNTPDVHMATAKDGRIVVNLENFICDIKDVMERYFKLLENDVPLRNKAIIRYQNLGILTVNLVEIGLPTTR